MYSKDVDNRFNSTGPPPPLMKKPSQKNFTSNDIIKKKRAPPPPPPPSRNKKEFVEALYDLEGTLEGDLSFSVGDRIEIIEKSNTSDDWWKGR